VAYYVEQGVPAPDRPWAFTDYERAAQALQRLGAERPELLPRHDSLSSGPVFARLASEESLAVARDRRQSLQVRVTSTLQVAQAVTSLLKLYLSAHARQPDFMPELTRLMVFSLASGATMFDVIAEAPVPPDGSADRAQYDKGRDQMAQGLATSLGGLLTTLSDLNAVAEPERLLLVEGLHIHATRHVSMLSAHTRQEFRGRLRSLAAAESSPAVRAQLEAFGEKLKP
jgi:hypothetical protein